MRRRSVGGEQRVASLSRGWRYANIEESFYCTHSSTLLSTLQFSFPLLSSPLLSFLGPSSVLSLFFTFRFLFIADLCLCHLLSCQRACEYFLKHWLPSQHTGCEFRVACLFSSSFHMIQFSFSVILLLSGVPGSKHMNKIELYRTSRTRSAFVLQVNSDKWGQIDWGFCECFTLLTSLLTFRCE